MCLASTVLASWFLTWEVASLNHFTVMTNVFQRIQWKHVGKTQLKHADREKGPEQKQQRAMTQVAQWKLNIKEWRSPTLTVESAMGAHTLEVMAINFPSLYNKAIRFTKECEFSSQSINE